MAIATVLCLLIGYPFAYFLARRAGRFKGLFLVLFFAPFWISYMLRMLAWISLLQDDGYVNKILMSLGIMQQPFPWLSGKPITVILGPDLRLRAVHDPAAVRARSTASTRPCWKPVATWERAPRGRSSASRCRSRARRSWRGS